MNTARQPVVVLISGRGSNMRSLIEQSRVGDAHYQVTQVFSDLPDAPGLQVARELGVSAEAVAPNGASRGEYDAALARRIDACGPALLALAGFMRILSPQFVERFLGRIVNIHPSLLPRWPGLHTHRRALEAGDERHGSTVHFVTAELDAGPRIVQASLDVRKGEAEAALAARVLALEHQIYPLAVRWFCEGRLRYEAGQAWLDGELLSEPVQFAGGA